MNPYKQKNDGGWCECSETYGCGRRFGGLTGFDAHLIPEHEDGSRHDRLCRCSDWDYRCVTDAELRTKGYSPDSRGWWRDQRAFPVPEGSTRTGAGIGVA